VFSREASIRPRLVVVDHLVQAIKDNLSDELQFGHD
jgi:hypothetical protein